jgi:epoxyqueuosine reductase
MLPPKAAPKPASSPEERAQLVREEARRLGFDAVAFARAEPLEEEFARYEAFLARGAHGAMAFLADDPEARRSVDHRRFVPGARTVICTATRTATEPGENVEARIARYARGRDYHNALKRKLKKLARFVGTLGDEGEEVVARGYVDASPMLERAWAARSGLGFIGKNGLCIVPGLGSMLLLGEVVTTLAIAPGEPLAERCGSCTRCLDACPTKAFDAPWVLDPRRCIAYLTIEHAGPIPEALEGSVGPHFFGCDDCQTACPFNACKATREPLAEASLVPLPTWRGLTLADLLRLDDDGLRGLTEATPLRRPGTEGLVRNAILALAASNPREEELAILNDLSVEHASSVVRETARRALDRIRAQASERLPAVQE